MSDISYNLTINGYGDSTSLYTETFCNSIIGDCYSVTTKAFIEEPLNTFISRAREALMQVMEKFGIDVKPRVRSVDETRFSLVCEGELIMNISFTDRMKINPWVATPRNLTLTVRGNPLVAREFVLGFLSDTRKNPTPTMTWHYMSGGNHATAEAPLPVARTIHRSFYPWLKEEPEAYIDNFLASECSLLLLRGEPGTGKTSFIQNLIWRSGKNAMFTYEEELFKSDRMFVDFMTGFEADIMVMEDADALLLPRDGVANTAMSKFLNVSDGLLRFPGKKMVISANVVDLHRIDAALLRPGRCFDAPVFSNLSYTEACRAAKLADITLPEQVRDYSLAEVFSVGNVRTEKMSRRFGFDIAA